MILLMYSGGLDSIGLLYKLLLEKEKILVHHIHLSNVYDRAPAEAIAVKNSLEWFKKEGYKFQYSESVLKMPDISNHFHYEPYVTRFLAATICLGIPEIKKIMIGTISTDITLHSFNKGFSIQLLKLFGLKDVKIEFPLKNMSKLDIYKMLPESLKNCAWSCRNPSYKEDKILPCNKCHTCKIYIEANIVHPIFNNLK